MERYFITGVQIGILKAVKNYPDSFKKIDEILKEIIDKQFIGNMLMPYEDYEIVIVKKKIGKEFSEKCDCELKPEHLKGEHDFCCQLCGGSHTERICPEKK
jgi:hypothetical protein